MARIVVIGAGVGGLGATLGLADRGHDVLVVERDPPPPTKHGDDAFDEWDRRKGDRGRRPVVPPSRVRAGTPPDGDGTPRIAIRWPAVVTGLIHSNEGGDQRAIALRYHDAVGDEADGVYRESAAMDRTRGYRWRGESVPDDDVAETERQALIAEGVIRGSLRDPVLGRAFLRRINLLDAPGAILDDPDVERRAREMREFYASRPPRVAGPDRAELLAAIERARPSAMRKPVVQT